MAKIAILGTVGVPAKYGGFETLAENLVLQNARASKPHDLLVYCSSKSYSKLIPEFNGARLLYIPLHANGKQAMLYDIWSLIDACLRGVDIIILLGHGGSLMIPILRLFTKTRFITNIDGIEWRREKWTGFARWIIRKTEAIAVRHSHVVVADNEAIRKYVADEFNQECEVIPYGGDHALNAEPDLLAVNGLPDSYALALCRIEPENNVSMILEAFDTIDIPLVFIGNWQAGHYGRELKARYKNNPNITILDSIYDPSCLRAIRDRASVYVHGHSAGGTNPSLVEMMHFAIPVLAFDCAFNRHTTEESAIYFTNAADLVQTVQKMSPEVSCRVGSDMIEIAHRRYSWDQVGSAYFTLSHIFNDR